MTNDQLVAKLQEWASYLHLYTPLNPLDMVVLVIRSIGWYLIVGLANLQDATNGLAVKALAILNIENYKGFKDFVTTYQPLFIALSMLFILMTLIGMMVNRGRDTNLFDFFRNLLIGMIVLVGFPWLWGQATDNTVQVAKYMNQSSAMSTHIILQNLTDLDYVADKYGFDTGKFNGGGSSNASAGLALDSTKNYLASDAKGNVSVSELNKIDPTAVIDPNNSAVSLSSDAQQILSNKLNYGSTSAKTESLGGGFFGFGAEHYFRYNWNFFRIAFYQILGILVSLILTFKVAQIGYEIWYNGLFIEGAALLDTRSGKRLLMMGQKFFVSLGAVLVIFVMQTLFNIGYAYIDGAIDTANLSGFLLNTILKLALFMTIIDGPNIFESAFGVDAGLKSATRAIIGANQGAQLMRSMGSGFSKLTKSTGRKVAGGAGFAAGAFSAFRGSSDQSAQATAMNKIGAGETVTPNKNTTTTQTQAERDSQKGEKGDAGMNGLNGQDAANTQNEVEATKGQATEKPKTPNIFEQEKQAKDLLGEDRTPTRGLQSGSALMDKETQQNMAQDFAGLSLPHDLSQKGKAMQEKISDYHQNMTNSVDKMKGIRQLERSDLKANLDHLTTPAPKNLRHAASLGHTLGKSLVKATGQSAERRAARREQKGLYDDFFKLKNKGDNPNGN